MKHICKCKYIKFKLNRSKKNELWCFAYQKPLRISSIGKLKPLLFWASVVLARVSHAKMKYTKVQNLDSVSNFGKLYLYMCSVTAISLGWVDGFYKSELTSTLGSVMCFPFCSSKTFGSW